jgi:hypothetical protein
MVNDALAIAGGIRSSTIRRLRAVPSASAGFGSYCTGFANALQQYGCRPEQATEDAVGTSVADRRLRSSGRDSARPRFGRWNRQCGLPWSLPAGIGPAPGRTIRSSSSSFAPGARLPALRNAMVQRAATPRVLLTQVGMLGPAAQLRHAVDARAIQQAPGDLATQRFGATAVEAEVEDQPLGIRQLAEDVIVLS